MAIIPFDGQDSVVGSFLKWQQVINITITTHSPAGCTGKRVKLIRRKR
jgi:hypothetical protein